MDQNEFLKDPLLIQQSMLSDYESKLDAGTVVDTNNAFMFMIESVSNIASNITRRIDDKLLYTYPSRATDTDKLYNHISDYDHIGFYSYPANITLRILLDKTYILTNAKEVPGANYSKVVIPKDTEFRVGPYTFGIHYPIEVRAVPTVGSITVVYDTTEINPLKTLDTNIITSYESNEAGMTLVYFDIPIYQFVKTYHEEVVTPTIGFKKTYTFPDKFYALRVTSVWENETFSREVDLALTMSDQVYDTSVPTAIFRVKPESNELTVEVPKIYFLNETVNTKLRLEVLTTQGEMNVDIGNLELEDIDATFNIPKNKTDELMDYVSTLRRIPTIALQPIDTQIVGGTNGMSFGEMKDSVVYSGASDVPITRIQVEQFFRTRGFTGILKVDNITDRIYYAYKRIANGNNTLGLVNSSLTMRLNMSPFDFESGVTNSKVLLPRTDHIVLLPGAMFKCNTSTSNLTIMTDAEVQDFKELPATDVVDKLENELITVYPYHLSCIKTDEYSRARTYDLFDSSIANIVFKSENLTINAQLTIVNGEIQHLDEGRGGYELRLGFVMSDDLRTVVDAAINYEIGAQQLNTEEMTEDQILAFYREVVDPLFNVEVSVLTIYGTYAKFETSFDMFYNELTIFKSLIGTDYELEDDALDVKDVVFRSGLVTNTRVPLTGKMNVIPTFQAGYFGATEEYDLSIRKNMVDPKDNFVEISHQTVDYSFGKLIDDVIDNNLYQAWEPETYKLHEEDVQATYTQPQYTRKPDGSLDYQIIEVDGVKEVQLTIEPGKDIGDPVFSDEGAPILLHKKGDPYTDIDGKEVVFDKSLSYTVELTTVDYRHYLTTPDFFKVYTSLVRAYFQPVREISSSILEETDVYFRETDTLTVAKFKINDTVDIKMSPDLSFEFKLFVAERVYEDSSLMLSIKESIQHIVENHVAQDIISISFITKDILEELGDYITAIDGISINGDQNIQTLVPYDSTRVARLGYEMKLSDTNEYYLSPAIDFNVQILDK